MPVTKRERLSGDWTLKLRDDAPTALTDRLRVLAAGFSTLLITAAWSHPSQVTLTDSIYSGVYRRQTSRTTIEGAHVTIWLGDEDGKSDFSGQQTVNNNLATWVTTILGWTPLSIGAVTAPGSPTSLNWTSPGAFGDALSPRDALNYVADFFGVRWRVNDNCTLDVGTTTALYGSAPSALLSSQFSGTDFGMRSVRCDMSVNDDLEDYTTRVLVLWDDAGTPTLTGADASATPFTSPSGNPVILKRRINSPDTTSSGNATSLATLNAARFGSARRSIDITTDHYALMAYLRCGEQAWMWDPDQWLVNTTAPPFSVLINYRGHDLFPVAATITSITMPIEAGMGVYMRAGNGAITDLTPYVEWESPGATIEVGGQRPSLFSTLTKSGTRL